jgi:BirA family biotin operon repressor/biotin-[acetyl-CoA-carboxylase] ligase
MLSEEARAAGFGLVHRSSVGSTMDEARALIGEGVATPFWVVADEQTGGRGRHGRQWSSPPGNLYATLALTDPCAPARGPELGFVAGVAVHQAVAEVARLGPPALGIKWPNDLLLNGAKVAGLLLEGTTIGGHYRVLIGFGVNIVSAPTGTPYPATTLEAGVGARSHDPMQTRDLYLAALSRAWLAADAQWREGFDGTRAAWLARAALVGQHIKVRPPSGPVEGTMRGVDSQGRLLLETTAGLATIDAGDVFPL